MTFFAPPPSGDGGELGASANGLSLVQAANYAAMRDLLNLEPGTDVQAFSALLAAFAGLTGVSGKLPRFTGADTFELIDTPSGGGSSAAGDVSFTPAGAIAASNVQAALEELDGEKQTSSQVSSAIAAAIADLINSAPGALDTLGELAAALGDDADFAATITAALAGKQPLDADLTAIAALTTTSYGRALLALADAAALRTAAEAQGSHANLTALAGLTGAAGKIPRFTGAGTMELIDTPSGGSGSVGVAIVQDRKTSTTNGQTLTVGSWTVRQLNTEVSDADGLVTVASNQISFNVPGTYLIQATGGVVADSTNGVSYGAQSRLYDASAAAVLNYGPNVRTETISGGQSIAALAPATAVLVVSSTKLVEFQTWINSGSAYTGFATSSTGGTEVYSEVLITKLV